MATGVVCVYGGCPQRTCLLLHLAPEREERREGTKRYKRREERGEGGEGRGERKEEREERRGERGERGEEKGERRGEKREERGERKGERGEERGEEREERRGERREEITEQSTATGKRLDPPRLLFGGDGESLSRKEKKKLANSVSIERKVCTPRRCTARQRAHSADCRAWKIKDARARVLTCMGQKIAYLDD